MSYCVCIHPEMDYDPYPHEMFAARVMSKYFRANVTFVKKNNTAKSADLKIKNQIWEIKSPTGNSKRTMLRRLNVELRKANNIKRLLVILKNKKVVVLK